MRYIARMEGEREQTLQEHLKGTADLAGQFADQFGNRDWGYCCGLLHDIGKYSEAFQKRVRGDRSKMVDHSTAGAQVCDRKGGLYGFISYCIAGHHAGLPDSGSDADTGDRSTRKGRMRKKIEDYQAYKDEIQIPPVHSIPFDLRKVPNQDFSMSVFIRMLYSCLVDADCLNAEYFDKKGQTGRDQGEEMTVLLEKLENYIQGWMRNQDLDSVNGRRTEILKHCLESGSLERGLFRLTVPTGGGKTVASLAFALRHAVENGLRRIIYVIPYTSIIEQNAEVFRKIVGEKNVLENHCNIEYTSSEEAAPMQLAAENWDKPIVVTTNVQFFESLFANKSSKCRKIHNIANSVIIFDEAQMLPNDYLKPCIAMMEELMNNYRASVVLCTATQPALSSFFKSGIPVTELCPRMREQFAFFKRVKMQNIGVVSEEALIEMLNQEHQGLCIVNTKKRAQDIYQKLKLSGEGVYHLSTTMYPKHRRCALDEIRQRLKEGKKCILIATSLVEAGVDFDFQKVYRQIAGADSVIQAAGRCNRDGGRTVDESVVSIFQFEEKEYVPGQRQQIAVTKSLLAEERDISSLESIQKYFEMLYHLRGESLDKKRIMDEFKGKIYNFAKVGKEFRLIEENTITIFIPKEDEAARLLQEMKEKGYTRKGMRRASLYSVQVYANHFEKLEAAGIVRPVSENIQGFYELTDQEQYTEDMGLNLGIDFGMAVLM